MGKCHHILTDGQQCGIDSEYGACRLHGGRPLNFESGGIGKNEIVALVRRDGVVRNNEITY